jgi:hypothetical protein
MRRAAAELAHAPTVTYLLIIRLSPLLARAGIDACITSVYAGTKKGFVRAAGGDIARLPQMPARGAGAKALATDFARGRQIRIRLSPLRFYLWQHGAKRAAAPPADVARKQLVAGHQRSAKSVISRPTLKVDVLNE